MSPRGLVTALVEYVVILLSFQDYYCARETSPTLESPAFLLMTAPPTQPTHDS